MQRGLTVPQKEDIKNDKESKVRIEISLCKGCGICIKFCPEDIFQRSKKTTEKGIEVPNIINDSECIECGMCELLCPELAIDVTKVRK